MQLSREQLNWNWTVLVSWSFTNFPKGNSRGINKVISIYLSIHPSIHLSTCGHSTTCRETVELHALRGVGDNDKKHTVCDSQSRNLYHHTPHTHWLTGHHWSLSSYLLKIWLQFLTKCTCTCSEPRPFWWIKQPEPQSSQVVRRGLRTSFTRPRWWWRFSHFRQRLSESIS